MSSLKNLVFTDVTDFEKDEVCFPLYVFFLNIDVEQILIIIS